MRDVNDNIIVFSRRDNNMKDKVQIDKIENHFSNILTDIQSSLFNQAKEFQTANTHQTNNYKDFQTLIQNGGFVKCGWDGTSKTEDIIKKDTKATIRCIPFEQNIDGLKCIYSNESAKYEVIFARAY